MPCPSSHNYFSQRLKLHYVDWGNPMAPPLLLVHGGRDHCRSWDWVAESLCDRYHIIAPDLRGHGDSQWLVGGSYVLPDYVYDITQLVHQANLAPVSIISHSLGGMICLQYAGLFPDNVRQIVAIEGLGMPPNSQRTPGSPIRASGRRSTAPQNLTRRYPQPLARSRQHPPRLPRSRGETSAPSVHLGTGRRS